MPKILVIDDDPLIRRIMSRFLERKGHQVILAEDGIEGVAKYRAEQPDLTITDMMMPRMGGLETIVKILEETPDARIVAASGGGNINGMFSLDAAKMHGATEILAKPFSEREFHDCVSRALDVASEHQEQKMAAE